MKRTHKHGEQPDYPEDDHGPTLALVCIAMTAIMLFAAAAVVASI